MIPKVIKLSPGDHRRLFMVKFWYFKVVSDLDRAHGSNLASESPTANVDADFSVPGELSRNRKLPQIGVSPATSGFRKADGERTRLAPRARSFKVFGAFPGLLSWAILGSPYGRRAAAGFFLRRSADGWRSGRNDDFGFSLHFRVLEATADPSSLRSSG